MSDQREQLNEMKKFRQLMEDGDCPTCNGWGEVVPGRDSREDFGSVKFDDILPCPDCGPDDGPAAQGKSKIVKQMGDEADSGWDVEDFPLAEGEEEETPKFANDKERYEYYKAKLAKLADGYVEEDFPAQGSEQECAWWAGCNNEATTTEPHPVLGAVPICDRCADKLRKMDEDDSEGKEFIDDFESKLADNNPCMYCDGGDESCEVCQGKDEMFEDGGHSIRDILDNEEFYALLKDLDQEGDVVYGTSYFNKLYDHFLTTHADEIPVGHRTGRPDNVDEYVLDNLENDYGEELQAAIETELRGRRIGETGETSFDDYGAAPVYENDAECDRCCGTGRHPMRPEDCPECHGTGECPKVDEDINLDSIVESVLSEYDGQPKDYEVSDDELETEVEDKNEIDKIDPNIEDEELGLRFD